MALEKIIPSLLIPLFLASGTITNSNPYEYYGKSKNEYLNCKSLPDNGLILSVKKRSGKMEEYKDFTGDRILDSVLIDDGMDKYIITKEGVLEILSNNQTNSIGDSKRGVQLLKIKQTQYTNYLKDILEIKKSKFEKITN